MNASVRFSFVVVCLPVFISTNVVFPTGYFFSVVVLTSVAALVSVLTVTLTTVGLSEVVSTSSSVGTLKNGCGETVVCGCKDNTVTFDV